MATRAFAILQKRWASVKNGPISIRRVKSLMEERLLGITFSDGWKSKYAFVWLRDNAPDPSINENSNICRQRKMLLRDLDPMIVPSEYSVAENGEALSIKWPDVSHPIQYSCSWLRDRDLQNAEMRRRRPEYYMDAQPTWGAKVLQEQLAQKGDWERMFTDEQYLMHELTRFMKYGIIRFENVPQKGGESERFGRLMGYMQESQHGRIFQIHSKDAFHNVASTPQALGLHTDDPCLENAPEAIFGPKPQNQISIFRSKFCM